ncbi:MAG: translation initiation factor IF-2 [Tissierellia bacterium]|nr:translation initiation factor IF-2 [Tissierellia bacterium]
MGVYGLTKIRVYKLAKELNMASRDLIARMKELDVDVNSHMSTLDKGEAETIKQIIDEDQEAGVDDGNEDTEVRHIETREKDIVKNSNGNAENKPLKIEDTIIVSDLAEKMAVSPTEVITTLIGLGVMANQNQFIDFETASIVGEEFGFEITSVEIEPEDEVKDEFDLDFEDAPEDLKSRPPVVTVMGHVDHGKTSLLDAIRETNVTEKEAGGITQHIGASVVDVEGNKVVFLDTPGHEAFTSMRARGTQVTDIAILVVAADDGVMPQTVEAIDHAKAAGVPIIVAINKIDMPDANIERIKQELTEYGLVPEDWGGDTVIVPVSALKGEGIDGLLEMILLVAELQELKANPDRNAVCTVVEAQLDRGRGPVATVLVQKGTLNVGEMIVCGSAYGRVRAMFDDKGNAIKKANPSVPAIILGLSEVPDAGDIIYVVDDEKTARTYAEKKKQTLREEELRTSQQVSLDDLFEKIKSGEIADLNIIIKTDVRGTIDAIRQSIEQLEDDEVRVNIIHGGVGGITESDIMLAAASNAIIIGFNVRPTLNALDIAEEQNVDVRTYRVIYEAIEDIKSAIKGMLEPEYVEQVIGRAEVRDTFKVPNVGTVAGIYVQQGKITRNSSIRLLRNNVVIFEGDVSSLRRFKDDVREVSTGYEGGLGLENYNDIKNGDILEAYIFKEVER